MCQPLIALLHSLLRNEYNPNILNPSCHDICKYDVHTVESMGLLWHWPSRKELKNRIHSVKVVIIFGMEMLLSVFRRIIAFLHYQQDREEAGLLECLHSATRFFLKREARITPLYSNPNKLSYQYIEIAVMN